MTRCKIWCKYLGCKPTWNVHMGIVGHGAVRNLKLQKDEWFVAKYGVNIVNIVKKNIVNIWGVSQPGTCTWALWAVVQWGGARRGRNAAPVVTWTCSRHHPGPATLHPGHPGPATVKWGLLTGFWGLWGLGSALEDAEARESKRRRGVVISSSRKVPLPPILSRLKIIGSKILIWFRV